MKTLTTLQDARTLDGEELIAAFEGLTLDPATFAPHEQHVRLAFHYLRTVGLMETLRRYNENLRRVAIHAGAPKKYHATVTCALIVLIDARLGTVPAEIGWEAFARENPDIMRFREGALFDLYPEAMLDSERARDTFLLPGMPL